MYLSRIKKKVQYWKSGVAAVNMEWFFKNVVLENLQTSDPELVRRKSISSWIEYEDLIKIMPQPLEIDVEKIPWKVPTRLARSLQGIVSINMIHVADWSCTIALFRES